jgi:hypothetical protein
MMLDLLKLQHDIIIIRACKVAVFNFNLKFLPRMIYSIKTQQSNLVLS